MSLRVWLPMIKDLRNQGLSNVTVTNNGATFNSAGKLGGCYSFGTGDSYITVDSTPLKTFTEFSFACWVKIISWNTSYSTVFAAKNSTSVSWNNLIFSLLRNSSNSTLCFNISNGSSTTTTNCQTGTLSLNTWYHITCTYKSGEIKLYQDGNVVSTYNTSIVPNFNSIVNLWIGKSNANSYQSNNLMNDVRIYDHCLSPMEVKELSKGLILHYPLNDKNIESTTNLNTKINMEIKTNSIWGGHSTTSTVYDCTNEPVPFNSGNKIEITYPVGDNTGGGTSVSLGVGIPVSSSTTYTLSTYLKASDNFNYWTANFLYYYGDTAGYGIFNINNKEYIADGWYRIWGTLTTGSNQTSLMPYFYSYPSENRTYYIGGWQLEQKNHMTPFVSPGGSRNNSIIYDCSGFCNNGTRTGTFSWTSDTPKYSVSTQFDSTSTKIQLPVMDFSGMANSYTFAWWQYNVSTGNMPWGFSNGNRLNCYHCSPLCWNTGDGSSNQFKDGSTTVAPTAVQNGWHHMVITGDGTATKLYIDGVYKGIAVTYKSLTGTQIWISGWDSGTSYTFNGSKECDFRIYATALSADDVKSLYQNCAYIDSSGNVYGAVHMEV